MTSLLHDESGQDLFEYALFIALIALIVIVTVTILGGAIATFYQGLAENFPG